MEFDYKKFDNGFHPMDKNHHSSGKLLKNLLNFIFSLKFRCKREFNLRYLFFFVKEVGIRNLMRYINYSAVVLNILKGTFSSVLNYSPKNIV